MFKSWSVLDMPRFRRRLHQKATGVPLAKRGFTACQAALRKYPTTHECSSATEADRAVEGEEKTYLGAKEEERGLLELY
jgi:hypothetical protein